MEGHQPPTMRQVGALTSKVTSLPAVTTATGVFFQVPRLPRARTGPASSLRWCNGPTMALLAGTAPPRYRAFSTASRSAGRPGAVTLWSTVGVGVAVGVVVVLCFAGAGLAL